MHVRSATGTPIPPPSPQPLPAPPRWHLRTQVSRKTLFDLIQDTLPPAGFQMTRDRPLACDGAHVRGEGIVEEERLRAAGGDGPGALPQAPLDPLGATIPMPLHPAALWNDGDTTPDIPEHWRPITITLASPPAQPPTSLAPAHLLHGLAKTAGWMLSGAALTFLIGAAAFGGKPMVRALRTVMAPHAQSTPDGPIPATQTGPARGPSPRPSGALPPGATVVALAERPRTRPRADRTDGSPSTGGERDQPPFSPGDDGGAASDRDDHRSAAAAARPVHRPRQDRRLARAGASTEPGRADAALLGADDAVMPLADARDGGVPSRASTVARPAVGVTAPVAGRSPGTARTISARLLRPIDVEDPFGGR